MTARWLLAAVHLLGLGVGLGAVWARGRALQRQLSPAVMRRVFEADSWWGVSAVLLIGTGVLRAFAGYEKGTAYYMQNHLFLGKLGLLVLILLLELAPMIWLLRWRVAVRRGVDIDTTPAPRYARISFVQAALLVVMIVLATGVARGYGAG